MKNLPVVVVVFLSFALIVTVLGQRSAPVVFHGEGCEGDAPFQAHFKSQVKTIAPDIGRIIEYIRGAKEAGTTYESLAYFVDKFGSRLTGTANLEASIDFMLGWLKKEGHENVHGENVSVPIWTRGKEWATMVKPREKKLNILGLGYAEGTGGKTLEAPVIVVKDFAELTRRSAEVKGKIVVYNYVYESYGQAVQYRSQGATQASKHGALAALIRSAAPFSINSPHTGMQTYRGNVTKIPAICITLEDADLFQRLADRKEEVVVRLSSENHLHNRTGISRNTVSEIVGRQNPEQVVIVSGHLDSWDVGQGAMDDGAGAFISWRALSVVKQLGLKPKRTLRSILWTGEEMGMIGAEEYLRRHTSQLGQFSVVMESDMGTFTPNGVTFSGANKTAQCTMHAILQLMAPINATRLTLSDEGSDNSLFIEKSVPISSLDTQNERYFWYHHSDGDTMTVENRDTLDKVQALWTSVAYALAAIDGMLPR